MRYFVLLMALVLSSCSHDDSQVNNGWVIYDLRPLQGGRVMYYGEDGGFSIIRSVSTTKNRYRISPCGCRGRNRTSKNRDLDAGNCLNIFKSSSHNFIKLIQ